MPGHIRRRRWPRWVGTFFVLISVLVGWWWEQKTFSLRHDQPTSGVLASGEYAVLRVIDGDTLLLEKDLHRVRLQGIDTPETVKENAPVEAWGKEATQYSKSFVTQAGGQVRLEFDGEPLDRYGRLLAFVWHDGRLLNEELVRRGLARAKLSYAFSDALKNRLRSAQEEAKASHRGIWGRE